MFKNYNTGRLDQFEIFRFIAAMAIIFEHTSDFQNSTGMVNNFVITKGYLYVNFFFVLGAFLLAYNYFNKDIKSYKDYIVPKLVRIYILLFFAYTFTLLFTARGEFTVGTSILWLTGTYNWLPSIQEHTVAISEGIGPFWYLSVYIFMILVFPFVKNLFDKYTEKAIVSSLIIYFITIFLVFCTQNKIISIDNNMLYYSIFFSFGSYLLGISFGYIYRMITPGKKYGIYALIAVAIYMIVITFNIVMPQQQSSILFAVIILLFALDTSNISKFLSNKFFVFLGSISFSMYMLHMAIYYMIGEIVPWFTYFVLMMIFVIIIDSLLQKKFTNYVLNKYYYRRKK